MNGLDGGDRERARRLMMAALDGELSGGERGELDRLLAQDAALREEWERMRRVKEVTSAMALRQAPEEVWDGYWTSVYNRLERGLGWILISLGAVVLLSFGAWHALGEILADAALPALVKAALFVLILGLILLFVSVLREKLFTRRHDPYREVKR